MKRVSVPRQSVVCAGRIKDVVALLIGVAACFAHARVEPGENVILNGSLDCDGTRIPGGWVCFNDDPGEICAEPWGCLGDKIWGQTPQDSQITVVSIVE